MEALILTLKMDDLSQASFDRLLPWRYLGRSWERVGAYGFGGDPAVRRASVRAPFSSPPDFDGPESGTQRYQTEELDKEET